MFKTEESTRHIPLTLLLNSYPLPYSSTVESGRSLSVKADDPGKDESGRSGAKADDPVDQNGRPSRKL